MNAIAVPTGIERQKERESSTFPHKSGRDRTLPTPLLWRPHGDDGETLFAAGQGMNTDGAGRTVLSPDRVIHDKTGDGKASGSWSRRIQGMNFNSVAPEKEQAFPRSPAALLSALRDNVAGVLLGKPEVVQLALVALLAEGHLLIEDVPGVGKTLLAKALARSLACSFHRIQFTPDLLPSDLLGVSVYNQARGAFVFQPGPLFAQVVLADEINRATPRTQSRPARSDERAPGVAGRPDPTARAAILRAGHAKSLRVRGHLSAAREPAGPLSHAPAHRLPGPRRRRSAS